MTLAMTLAVSGTVAGCSQGEVESNDAVEGAVRASSPVPGYTFQMPATSNQNTISASNGLSMVVTDTIANGSLTSTFQQLSSPRTSIATIDLPTSPITTTPFATEDGSPLAVNGGTMAILRRQGGGSFQVVYSVKEDIFVVDGDIANNTFLVGITDNGGGHTLENVTLTGTSPRSASSGGWTSGGSCVQDDFSELGILAAATVNFLWAVDNSSNATVNDSLTMAYGLEGALGAALIAEDRRQQRVCTPAAPVASVPAVGCFVYDYTGSGGAAGSTGCASSAAPLSLGNGYNDIQYYPCGGGDPIAVGESLTAPITLAPRVQCSP